MDASPLDEYARRRRLREADAARHQRTHVRLGNAKVAIFIAILIYWAVTLQGVSHGWVYGVAVATFIALSVWHERVMRAMARASAAVAFYDAGTKRIEDTWMTPEPSGIRFRDANHPYADDLDVFGPASLFQLLSLCRTPMGEATLAGWLLQPAAAAIIVERQARVAALRDRVDLRERVAVVNVGRRRLLLPDRLIAWAERRSSLMRIRVVVVGLALAFVAAVGNYMYGGSGWPIAAALLVNAIVISVLGKRANASVEALSSATGSAELDLLSSVIREIEHESFETPALVALAGRLKGSDGRVRASRGIARLARISDWADSRHNVFLRLAEIPLLITLQVAYAAESWRRDHGGHLRDWIDAIGEMEALLSVAGYSYEHPEDPFAEIVERTGPLFEAEEIGHPLIPAAVGVRNSVRLVYPPEGGHYTVQEGSGHHTEQPGGGHHTGHDAQVLIVSGSNMSGKSTWLRTTGINAVLALAGAPVRARRLRLSPLTVGTCLRHTDSLQEHRSGFYTEALRIRRIADLLGGPLPVLFLFDELLSGTNSKDRRIAAEGVIKTMLAKGAIGMVTTHDLSLTEIAAIFSGQVRNVHLQDHVEGGRMVFDYRLRDGVITHSNALALMRMIGLDV